MLLKDQSRGETVNGFDRRVIDETGGPLSAERIATIQANVGLVCNQECTHCHVAASPKRRERMEWDTMARILDVARAIECGRVDITGGAPELNPHFRRFVGELVGAGVTVQVRTNLTVLLEPGREDTAAFMAERGVALVASLPCYLEENVDRQRGEGVYQKSIESIRRLNAIGYGTAAEHPLDLVYNPIGPQLPPEQAALERDYHDELRRRHGIEFTRLLTITNMPIGRFMRDLRVQKKAEAYAHLLRESFNPQTVCGLMCRHQISVDWDGAMYDCDFNLALRMPVNHGMPTNIRDFSPQLHARRIETGAHCFGCTAGSGSSCGGALA